MRIRLLGFLFLATAVAVAAWSGTARSEDEPMSDEPTSDEGAAWMALGEPGEHHAWLGKFVGDWSVEATFQLGEEPTTTKATARISSKWEGRYFVMHYRGEFMGSPFEGEGTWAYNNGAKRYEGSWIDGFSTALVTSTGERTENVLTMKGEMYGPKGKIATRDVVTLESDDRWTLISYWTLPDGEVKAMNMTYTRQGTSD